MPPVATSHHYLQETYKQLLLALRAPNEGAALHYFVQVHQLAPKLQQLTFWVALSLSAVECAVASELPQDGTCEVSGVRGKALRVDCCRVHLNNARHASRRLP